MNKKGKDKCYENIPESILCKCMCICYHFHSTFLYTFMVTNELNLVFDYVIKN